MRDKILFDKKIHSKKCYGVGYNVYETLLWVNNVIFDSYGVWTEQKQKFIDKNHKRYWRNISKFYLPDHQMIVRLTGLDFRIDDVKKFLDLNEWNFSRNIILNHIRWHVDQNGCYIDYDEELIEVDKRLFKILFEKFWFCLGMEYRFEAILMEPEKVYALEKWSRAHFHFLQ